MKTLELYKLIGEVTNTYCTTKNKHGVTVMLDSDSKCVVDKTSYLNGLTVASGAGITAPEGVNLSMTVDGVHRVIGAGS